MKIMKVRRATMTRQKNRKKRIPIMRASTRLLRTLPLRRRNRLPPPLECPMINTTSFTPGSDIVSDVHVSALKRVNCVQ